MPGSREAVTAGPLAHLRVVDCGRTPAAALCAKFFADLGARTVKIEPPEGDPLRHIGPFPDDRPDPERSALFHHANTNKYGVTLDLNTAEGRTKLAALAAWADILVEDWPVNEPLPLVAPDGLIHVSITPFGHRGPYAGYLATDLIAFHASGAGHRYDGMPDREPLRAPCHQAHQWGAIAAATGALTAYFGRLRSGRGQYVEVSEAEVIAQMLVAYGQVSVYFDPPQQGRTEVRTGYRATQGGPNAMLPCKDGYVCVTALEPHQWEGLVEAMGSPEWAQTALFKGSSWDRHPYIEEIYALMAEWLESHTKEEIFQACQALRVPATPVLTVAEVAASPHLNARGFFAEIDSPAAGRLRLPGAPYRFTRTPWALRRPAPLLGEHNRLVFDEWLDQGERQEASGKRGAVPGPVRAADVARPAAGSMTVGAGEKPEYLPPDHPLAVCRLPLAAFPLRGLRVVNFGWVWAAPVAAHLLADMGAEVIKVESRRRVDITRRVPPLLAGHPESSFLGQNIYRSQLSITLNLANPAAVALARRLVAQADAVIENFSPGVMARYGLSYAELAAVRPDLVMISMSATGQSGPWRDILTYGSTLSALTGFDSLNGYAGERPLPMGTTFQDPLMGLYAAFAVLAALAHRFQTGEGQYIDMAQLEAATSMLGQPLLDYAWNGRVGRPQGNRDLQMAPHGVYPTRPEPGAPVPPPGGRWIAIACRTDADWRALCAVAGRDDWLADPRFATPAGRKQHEDTLDALIAGWTAGFTNTELTERLQAAGVPAAPAVSTRELFEDPHYRARQSWVEVEHPYGRETIYGLPFHLSETPGGIRRAAPLLGQDNAYVFEKLLGLSEAEVERLVRAGVIA